MAAGLSICIDRCDPAGNFCSVLSTSTRKSGHKSSCDHLPNGSKSCRDWTIYNFVSAEPHRSQTFWQNEKKHAGKYWYWQNQCGCGPSLISNRKYLDLYSERAFSIFLSPAKYPCLRAVEADTILDSGGAARVRGYCRGGPWARHRPPVWDTSKT